jgi:predicted branched-subunit amino acid permease
MWAGPAQLILYSGLAMGVALPALTLGVALSSVRFLPMTMSILPLVRRPDQSIWVQLLAAHYVTVTIWVHSLQRLPLLPAEQRTAYYFGFANATLMTSGLMTYAGYSLAPTLPAGLGAALLFLNPIYFTISLLAGATRLAERSAIILGLVLAPTFSELVGRDLDLIAAGFIGGTAAYILNRRTRATHE